MPTGGTMLPGRRLALATGAVGLLAVAALCGPAQPPGRAPTLPRGYVCYRAPSPVAIDGRLTDDAWSAAPWSDPFEDIEGDQRPKPRHRTRVQMPWADEALDIRAALDEAHVCGT